MTNASPKLLFAALAIWSLGIGLAFQGDRGLFETTEGRYAECAREMVASGNYLEPSLENRPHWTKPPMTYWAITGGMKLLGRNEWGVRLYSAIAFALTVLLVAGLGTVMFGRRVGFTAGLVYSSFPTTAISAFAVSADTLLTLWETAALLCFVLAAVASGRSARNAWITVMWMFFGLGFLTKGPPALIPLIPVVVWGMRRHVSAPAGHVVGLLLFIAIGLSWYVAMCLRHEGLLTYFIGTETFGRIATGDVHNRSILKAFPVYVPVLTLGTGLWIYHEFRLLWQKRLYHPRVVWQYLRGTGWASFLVLWVLPALVLFCVSRSKLQMYVLPLLVPMAVGIARSLYRDKEEGVVPNWILLLALIGGMIIFVGKGVASYWPHEHNMRQMYQEVKMLAPEGAQVIVVGSMRFHGLQFYMDGEMERWIRSNGDESRIEATVRKGLDGVVRSPGQAYLLIVPSAADSIMKELLRKAGVPYESTETRYGFFYAIRARN